MQQLKALFFAATIYNGVQAFAPMQMLGLKPAPSTPIPLIKQAPQTSSQKSSDLRDKFVSAWERVDVPWSKRVQYLFSPTPAVPPVVGTAPATPKLADDEVKRRKAARAKIIERRQHALRLECKLCSVLRVAGEKPSKQEADCIESLCAELEGMQAQAAELAAAAAKEGFNRSLLSTPPTELGSWVTLHAPSSSILKKLLRKSAEADTREVQRVTYISQYLRLARGKENALYVFQRVTGGDPACEDCATPSAATAATISCNTDSKGAKWIWPL